MAISPIPLPSPVTLDSLKSAKNSVIGNPTAKVALAREPAFVAGLVDALNADVPEQVKIEAAQVLSSLSFGPESAIKALLDASAQQALLYALSRSDSASADLRAAYARALRVLAGACAELVGPSLWSVREYDSVFRDEARAVLDYVYQRDALDIFLPLLLDPHPAVSASICLTLSTSLRISSHRTATTDWLPPLERAKEASKPRRGWERPRDATNPTRQGGGWTARTLTGLVRGAKDVKVQEASLLGLAALVQENGEVAGALSKSGVDAYGFEGPSALSSVLALCKNRVSSVQLAACLCAAQIIRASISGHHHHHHHPPQPDTSSSLTILNALNRLISSPTEPAPMRTKACVVLRTLTSDQKELCALALERGSLSKLAGVVTGITPSDASVGWDEGEAAATSLLRESALLAIASLAVLDNEVRHALTSSHASLLPCISSSLCASSVGVRYGACQCVRALGRSVAVARTSLVDSGLGERLYDAFQREDEVGLVTGAALMAVCNLIAEFSPLRQPFLARGLVPRLSALLHTPHHALRLNALWALKNLVYKSPSASKRAIMRDVAWAALDALLVDGEPDVREQAWNVVRNFCDCEEDVEVAFLELGTGHLLDRVADALDVGGRGGGAGEGEVVLQAAGVLNNLSNGAEAHRRAILSHAPILAALRSSLVDAPMEVRRAAVHCVYQLASTPSPPPPSHPQFNASAVLVDAGILGPLRHICDNSSTVAIGPGTHGGVGGGGIGGGGIGGGGVGGGGVEREVRDVARKALDLIEIGLVSASAVEE